VATKCIEGLGLTLPTLVDSMDDATSRAYGAWPDRFYVVGLDGRIAYAGEPGPRGFDVDAVQTALKGLAQ
jgi:hypothetical protein